MTKAIRSPIDWIRDLVTFEEADAIGLPAVQQEIDELEAQVTASGPRCAET